MSTKLKFTTPAERQTALDLLSKKLEEFQKETGLTVAVEKTIFTRCGTKVEVRVKVTSLSKEEEEKSDFERNCHYFGLTPQDFLAECIFKGKKYELFGFKMNARKNSFRIRDDRGNEYLTSRNHFGTARIIRKLQLPAERRLAESIANPPATPQLSPEEEVAA